MKKFIRQLIEVEIRLGFLNIPAHGVEMMPSQKSKVSVTIKGKKKVLSYNPEYRRIFGLTKYYKEIKAKPKDTVELSMIGTDSYELKFLGKQELPVAAEAKEEEAEETEALDLSGLSTQAKGDIVEDRMKELLMLHGQGLLSVYKPVTDTEGTDLIVVRSGQFHPIFLQVKGRFNLDEGKSIILNIKVKTFTAHSNYYVIGAYFNPSTLEIDPNILLIPSKDLIDQAITVKAKNGEWYSVVASLNDGYTGKWGKYLIKKDELASKLIEKFEEMHKYIK